MSSEDVPSPEHKLLIDDLPSLQKNIEVFLEDYLPDKQFFTSFFSMSRFIYITQLNDRWIILLESHEAIMHEKVLHEFPVFHKEINEVYNEILSEFSISRLAAPMNSMESLEPEHLEVDKSEIDDFAVETDRNEG
jgi:hypothetical protein